MPRRFLWANSYANVPKEKQGFHDRFRVNIFQSQVGVGGSHERCMAWKGRLLYLNNENYIRVLRRSVFR